MLRRLFALFALAALATAFACNVDDSTDVIAPITGIAIRAESLTSGRGCGTSPPQIYKYVALVYGYDGITDANDPAKFKQAFSTPVAASVFDCFSDGAFVSLPVTNNSLRFRIELYLYVAPAYERSRATLDPISGPFPPGLGDTLRAQTNPTWTTQCAATQQDLVEVLAICDPLATSEAGGPSIIQIPTASFARGDGGTIGCGDVDGGIPVPSPDAGEDAGDGGDEGGNDAGDGGTDASTSVDAGAAGTTYRTVRVRTRIDLDVVGPTVDLTCPTAFFLSPATPLTTYTFDVGLLDSNGKTVGSTTCSAAAEPGSASTATCAPVP